MIISRSIQVDANGVIAFFLRLSGTASSLCTRLWVFRASVSQLINSAAVNVGVHASFPIIILG